MATSTGTTPQSLSQKYRDYIAAINKRDWQVVGAMVQPEVVWNAKPYSTEAYIGLITRGTIPVPDIVFHIDLLIADETEQRVAARLLIRGTPTAEFLGFQPNGKSIELIEHVFYKFENGRIAEVKTVLDMERLREQLR